MSDLINTNKMCFCTCKWHEVFLQKVDFIIVFWCKENGLIRAISKVVLFFVSS